MKVLVDASSRVGHSAVVVLLVLATILFITSRLNKVTRFEVIEWTLQAKNNGGDNETPNGRVHAVVRLRRYGITDHLTNVGMPNLKSPLALMPVSGLTPDALLKLLQACLPASGDSSIGIGFSGFSRMASTVVVPLCESLLIHLNYPCFYLRQRMTDHQTP